MDGGGATLRYSPKVTKKNEFDSLILRSIVTILVTRTRTVTPPPTAAAALSYCSRREKEKKRVMPLYVIILPMSLHVEGSFRSIKRYESGPKLRWAKAGDDL